MGFQFGVHVMMADLGLSGSYHMRTDIRVDDETWSKHANVHMTVECRPLSFRRVRGGNILN